MTCASGICRLRPWACGRRQEECRIPVCLASEDVRKAHVVRVKGVRGCARRLRYKSHRGGYRQTPVSLCRAGASRPQVEFQTGLKQSQFLRVSERPNSCRVLRQPLGRFPVAKGVNHVARNARLVRCGLRRTDPRASRQVHGTVDHGRGFEAPCPLRHRVGFSRQVFRRD